ncbi:hypothetical protein [Peribacillus simplex]|uniref:hypothetical protein n=1 Tax=Peribacillus simplex TaxID=1478 RepID=UPI0021A985D7|nr:hypothetical protein [Peribacillus simplex]
MKEKDKQNEGKDWLDTSYSCAFDGGGIIYYFINLSLYETTEGLYEFPVPKNAKLVLENELGKNL